MDLSSIIAIVASLAVILTFVWNIFFGRRTLTQLLSKWSKRFRNGGASAIRQNLPHRFHETLWGRNEELQKIAQLLQKSRPYIVAIEGIAGIGKTALALEVAHRIKEGKLTTNRPKVKFDAIIWASAKHDILLPEGIRSRDRYVQNIDDVYTAIAVTLEEPQILQVKREHQAELISAVLAKHQVLLILDNIEVLVDERIITFIHEVPEPTKVIVTTRHRIGGDSIKLQGLDRRSSLSLIQKETEEPRGLNLPEHVRSFIYDKTGGVPLAIMWIIGRLRISNDPEVVLNDLANPSSDISRFCFEQSMVEIRGRKAWEILYVVTIFRKGAKMKALDSIMNSQPDTSDELILLTRLSLINRNDGRFTTLRLTRTYVQEVAQKETPELGIYLKTRFVDYYADLLRRKVGSKYWDGRFALNTWDRFGEVVDEIDEVREAIEIAYSQERWDIVRDLVFGIVHILWVLDRWEQRVELTNMAIHAVQKLGLLEDEAWLRIDALGFIYLAQGDYENAMLCCKHELNVVNERHESTRKPLCQGCQNRLWSDETGIAEVFSCQKSTSF